ncbi:MAG: hypothetical protein QGF16_00780 [Rhodospirillales bacterium]|jgi:hypothetical protein|nr:hypothetical protein [Rhodospirillales bacterium]
MMAPLLILKETLSNWIGARRAPTGIDNCGFCATSLTGTGTDWQPVNIAAAANK